MASRTNPVNQFEGGISFSESLGIKNSYRFSKHLNIHKDPSFVTLYPKTTKKSGSTVVDLIKWIVDGSPWTTNRYAFGDAGKFYEITNAEAYSVLSTRSGSHGNGLLALDDYIYLANDSTLDRYGRLSATPAITTNYIEDGTIDLFETNTGTGNTYTTPTSISEAATARQTITQSTQKDPIRKISVKVTAKGTGDWTVTVHDAQNNSIGSATVANATLNNTAFNDFTFATPLRINKNGVYHFHVTSTVADGTVDTGTASDLENSGFKAYYSVLITDTSAHPMIEHLGKLIIGNERYLATQEGNVATTYDPNRVPLGQGFKVRCLAKDDEFVVAACWKGADVDNVEEARLYWWEGTLDRPSFSRNFPAGLIHCLHTDHKGRLVLIAGGRAKLYLGSGGNEFTFVQEAPKLADNKKMTIYPGAITTWNERTLIGYSNTTDASFNQGVYEFGNGSDMLPEVLNHAFTISSGNFADTDIEIGCVKGIGEDLYISWIDADNATYGLDKVVIADNPAGTGTYESLIIDNGNPHKEKTLYTITLVHDPIATGGQIRIKYKLDRATDWTTGDYNDVANSKTTELNISASYKELEYGFDLIATTNYPKIKAIVIEWDDKGSETSQSDPNV
jgi:hypothetical protein